MTAPHLSIKQAIGELFGGAEGVRNKTIADVGCGDGWLVRHLAEMGAAVFGIEVSEAQLVRARANAGSERYLVASAQALPLRDASMDAIIFLNSFHHVPEQAMGDCLREAARVLRVGGLLIVIEPLAEGPFFEAMRPIEDETDVRAKAYAALKNPPSDLRAQSELYFQDVRRFADADQFIETVLAADPARRARLGEVEAPLREGFHARKSVDDAGAFFSVPLRRNVFRRMQGAGAPS